jgi:hypothetical protein
MEFKCEASLLAKMPETRQHFLYFSQFFIFTRGLFALPHYLRTRAKAHLLAERAKACQYFFPNFLKHQ